VGKKDIHFIDFFFKFKLWAPQDRITKIEKKIQEALDHHFYISSNKGIEEMFHRVYEIKT